MIVLDANVLIALLDERDSHHEAATQLLIETPPPYLVHPLTLAEVLVGPARLGREEDVLRDLEDIGVEVEGFRREESLRLARLRAGRGLTMSDTCVLSVAAHHDVRLATFDRRLAEVAGRKDILRTSL